MANKLSPYQAFTNMKSGIAAVVTATEQTLKASMAEKDPAKKQVGAVTKASLEKTKAKGFKEFCTTWQIPVVEGKVAGARGGLVQTATGLVKGDANHALVKAANAYHLAGTTLQTELKKVGRSLSPGYIRKADATPAPAAGSPA